MILDERGPDLRAGVDSLKCQYTAIRHGILTRYRRIVVGTGIDIAERDGICALVASHHTGNDLCFLVLNEDVRPLGKHHVQGCDLVGITLGIVGREDHLIIVLRHCVLHTDM